MVTSEIVLQPLQPLSPDPWASPPPPNLVNTRVVLTEEEAAKLHEAEVTANAPNTVAQYRSAWAGFSAWADREGHCILPAEPEAVSLYLLHLADEGRSSATVRVHLSAVNKAHELAGIIQPGVHPRVKTIMKSLGRRLGRRQKQAAPLNANGQAAIRATAGMPRRGQGGNMETPATARQRGLMDMAMVSVMRDGLLRIGEAAALVWSDIEWEPDGTGRLIVQRSKTDQEGKGSILYLGVEAMEALSAIWLEGGDESARVFGLSVSQMRRRIKRAAQVAGLNDEVNGHSARIGMAIDLAQSGTWLVEMQNAGRWKSSEMPARYTQGVAAGQGAVAKYYATRQ